jgi:hypothetical protein
MHGTNMYHTPIRPAFPIRPTVTVSTYCFPHSGCDFRCAHRPQAETEPRLSTWVS